ncbi:transcription repressor OFP16-like [Andrographis paniculata]|uniref:transcription repressor OFP16-like n=1 Tax=Andrographis paniculata TaxID=175694 RepID=UPI0021E80CCB|nr:transcription repressor OFP16-like [Andrographis paniculata]
MYVYIRLVIRSIAMAAGNLNSSFSKIKSQPSDSIYIKTYNSLYQSATAYSDSDSDDTPDFATAFASRRFFFSSPGRSNSIIDSASSTSRRSSSSENDAGGTVAVPTFSPDPFVDFRRSMQEMVEAREINDVLENWEYLHQLLLCYLSLNPKSCHKYIVGAFADLVVGLLPPPIEEAKLMTGKFFERDQNYAATKSSGIVTNTSGMLETNKT